MEKGFLYFLAIMNGLLRNIGSEQNIIPKEMFELLENKIENKDEIAIVDSFLSQLQNLNVQMEQMKWMNTHYRILHEFAQICSKTLNEDILLEKTYEMVSQVMSADSFFIVLYTEGDSHLDMVFMVENGKIFPKRIVEFGDNYTSKVIKTREIIHEKQSSEPKEFDEIIGEYETSACLFVPVIIDDHVKGVISAQSLEDFAYRKEHEELLQIIGAQVINSIETARLYEKIYSMSQTDELTALKNHRAFHEDLTKLINQGNQEITLVMIDSDHLKKVNDNYGHDFGDKYLRILADGIKSISNEHIEGYRYAGDEFMIIIKPTTNNGIDQLYEKLLEYYSSNTIVTSNEQIRVSISSGVAVYPTNGLTVDSLKKSVDDALYLAKKQGGNQLVIAD
ncbi:sensor domain-containing diguanylate cyclase [Neobacillus sp. PS3-40]|uniref:sensor domain-containing diguanylate cyclase n=1 Tax=Neobacillus sp. PS3-40 TaxID=3070679 RepID=UPI0027DF8098|nr:sensor domain-containing diguanylate cyclase [Neobacillus sp. PS3-40]WML43019.1 sensor domain-containing diguanylate cyclase [Neobacillus sp. PS3-40]